MDRFWRALPFWLSLGLAPIAVFEATHGGWTIVLLPVATWGLFTLLDLLTGLNTENSDPNQPEHHLFWYRLITVVWFPVQFLLIFGLIAYVSGAEHLDIIERIGIFFGIGVLSGTIGITYAHELMHQKNAFERWMGDLILATVLYSHFRSEHLLVHHRHVGTPKDAVTARYNEGFHRFFFRVLWQCLVSAWHTEARMLARKDLPWWDAANPFWRYAGLQTWCLLLAMVLGGWVGLGLFLFQSLVAVWQLELVNYVEHYGLTRKKLETGKYEHVKPHHSWNASHRASNWLLINLQRHSDHHYKPDRRFPLLQTYDSDEAPQLPYGYPVMTALAMVPPAWRRVMNPRVRKWRAKFYPEITDWGAQAA
ncbi:MAG: alkane 1-monooxygenase [Rhodobacteraceae bacterium]|nr:alkane 1-monooxygenase [Paracoccaceae bacterium]